MRTVFLSEIAAALGVTKRSAERRASDEAWPFQIGAGRGGPRQFPYSALPPSIRRALDLRMVCELRERLDIQPLAKEPTRAKSVISHAISTGPKAEARRDAKVAIYEAFIALRAQLGTSEQHARTVFSATYLLAVEALRTGETFNGPQAISTLPRHVFETHSHMSTGTIRRIVEQLQGGQLARLAGAYGGRKDTGVLDIGKAPSDGEPVAQILLTLIVDHPHFSVAELRRQLIGNIGAEIQLPSGELVGMPPLRTFQRTVAALKEKNAANILAVTNPDAWRSRYQVAFGDADEGEGLNDLWMIDASPADVLLTDGRYSIYVLIDVWSRQIMTLVTKTPRAEAVVALLRKAIIAWGVPSRVKTDNGSDFVAKRVREVLLSLDVDHNLSPAFTPTDKAFVERVIGTVQHRFMSLLPGFIGHNVAERSAIESRRAFAQRLGESDADIFCVELTETDLSRRLADWVTHDYHHSPHEGLDGETPATRMALAPAAARQVPDVRALDMLLAEPASGGGARTVTKKGIRVENATFWGAGLNTGDRVRVRLDAADLGRVYVYSADGTRFICVAENPERIGRSRIAAAQQARAEQREEVAAFKAAARRTRRRLRPAHEVAAEQARAALPPVIQLPRPSVPHETPALSAAADAAGLMAPAAPVVPTKPAEPARIIDLTQRLETPAERRTREGRERFARWKGLNARIVAGETLPTADAAWHANYGETPECQAARQVEALIAAGMVSA